MKKKQTKHQIEAFKTTWANKPNIHISLSPEVVSYRKKLLQSLPEWREKQIRIAHNNLLKEKRRKIGHARHPVLMENIG